jgi:hypothetical protein
MHSGFDTTSNSYYRLLDTLNFNSWHRYLGWFPGDDVDGDPGIIATGVTGRVTQNNSRNIRTIFQRPVTTYAAYGQRSDYQCEKINTGDNYWFYAYNTSTENAHVSDVSDSGGIVKHASLNAGEPGVWEGYLVKNLRSNREQCNKQIGHLLDNVYKWYVKPRIRIPIGLSDTIKVCRIEIIDWDDSVRKSVDLTALNFRRQDTAYSGKYMDEFYFNPNVLSAIEADTSEICPGPPRDPYGWKNSPFKTDFRVYWYGQCDMWIDYIRVENDPAQKLFEDPDIENRIIAEVNFAMADFDPERPNHFYQEEFEFNHSPCIKRVNEIIESESDNDLTFMVNLNVEMYNTVVPYYYDSNRVFGADDIQNYLIDYANIKILIPTTYDLEGYRGAHYPNDLYSRASLNPNTLPVYSQPGNSNLSYDSSKGLLAYTTTPSEYDDWLQYRFDEILGYPWRFTNIFKMCDTIRDNTGIAIMDLHQTHLWYEGGYRLKEPTNQEMEVCANLAVSYGIKGILYFAYDGNVVDD